MQVLEQWQWRVVDEREQLAGRLERLRAFIKSDKFEELNMPERDRLQLQEWYMSGYLHQLDQRIGAWSSH